MAELMPVGSLHQRTRELLKTSEKSLPVIYRESGISFFWLRKFSSGELKNPSVNKVQQLYEFLTGKKLTV